MKERLNWEDIQYFLKLIEERSVSGAARALDVKHNTVVRRVNRFEQAVGAKLFDRLPRLWQPTSVALSLIETAKDMERQALSLERRVKQSQESRQRVRISVSPLLAEEIVIPGLKQFVSEHPEISLEIQTETYLSDIGKNESEIAIRLASTSDLDLTTRRLATLHYGIFGTPEFSEVPEEEWPWIAFDDNMSEVQLAPWYERRVNPDTISVRTGDFRAMAASAANGWGVTLLPLFLAKRFPMLQLLQSDAPTLDVAMVSHRDLLDTPTIRTVCNELVTQFSLVS